MISPAISDFVLCATLPKLDTEREARIFSPRLD